MVQTSLWPDDDEADDYESSLWTQCGGDDCSCEECDCKVDLEECCCEDCNCQVEEDELESS